MQISGKTVLITGAGRGLGAAMARGLAERGADLALVDLDESGLRDVADACRGFGRRAETYSANVADEADVVKLFDRVAVRTLAGSTARSPMPEYCATVCSSR
jgi:3-oxoacyl-[acyl-carrier protein] reductase